MIGLYSRKLNWIYLKTSNGIIIRRLIVFGRLVYFVRIIFNWQFFEIFQTILIGFSMESRVINCLGTKSSLNNPEFRSSRCASNSSVLFSKLSLRWVLTYVGFQINSTWWCSRRSLRARQFQPIKEQFENLIEGSINDSYQWRFNDRFFIAWKLQPVKHIKCFAIIFITGNGKFPQSGWFLRLFIGFDCPITLLMIQIDVIRFFAKSANLKISRSSIWNSF